MGLYNCTYIGPYLLIKKKTVQKRIMQRYLPGSFIPYMGKGYYCPDTGVELEQRAETIEETKELRYFENPLDENAFFSPPYPELKNETLQIINRSGDLSYFNDDTFVYDMSDLDLEEIFSKFRNEYEAYFEYLDDNGWEYSRHYGVINYAS